MAGQLGGFVLGGLAAGQVILTMALVSLIKSMISDSRAGSQWTTGEQFVNWGNVCIFLSSWLMTAWFLCRPVILGHRAARSQE